MNKTSEFSFTAWNLLLLCELTLWWGWFIYLKSARWYILKNSEYILEYLLHAEKYWKIVFSWCSVLKQDDFNSSMHFFFFFPGVYPPVLFQYFLYCRYDKVTIQDLHFPVLYTAYGHDVVQRQHWISFSQRLLRSVWLLNKVLLHWKLSQQHDKGVKHSQDQLKRNMKGSGSADGRLHIKVLEV